MPFSDRSKFRFAMTLGIFLGILISYPTMFIGNNKQFLSFGLSAFLLIEIIFKKLNFKLKAGPALTTFLYWTALPAGALVFLLVYKHFPIDKGVVLLSASAVGLTHSYFYPELKFYKCNNTQQDTALDD